MNSTTPEPTSTTETHGDVTYTVTPMDDGLVSYKPADACKPWCSSHRDDVCHADNIRASYGGDVGLTYAPAEGVLVHINDVDALSLDEALDYNQAILNQVTKAVTGVEPTPTPDPMRELLDMLGVDDVTGLDLADAVKVGMVLGQALASDADARLAVQDLTDMEHDSLKHAVQDVLYRRRGVDPDHERALLAFRWGSMSAWSIAVELDMDARAIARAAKVDHEGPFSDAERDRLLDLLDDILDEREGITPDKPLVLPYDAEGRCIDNSDCVMCRAEGVTA